MSAWRVVLVAVVAFVAIMAIWIGINKMIGPAQQTSGFFDWDEAQSRYRNKCGWCLPNGKGRYNCWTSGRCTRA